MSPVKETHSTRGDRRNPMRAGPTELRWRGDTMNRMRTTGGNRPVTYEMAREIARGLPGVVEGMSYGTAALRVGKSLFARQHQDGESLVIKIDPRQRAMRMRA